MSRKQISSLLDRYKSDLRCGLNPSHKTPEQWYNRGMNAVVRLVADGLMIPIVAVALFALFFRAPQAQRYQRYTRVFMAGLTSYWCAKVIGALWQPETLRPFEKLGTDPGALYLNNPGFPSDHALFAMFLTLAVWYVTRQRLLTVALFVMTVLVCLGRVAALVHTPLDVAGGVAIALLGAVWYVPHHKKFWRRLAKSAKT